MVGSTDDLLGTAAVALGRGPLTAVDEPLVGSSRTRVVRAMDPSGRTVVVKQYLEDPAAFVREASALAALGSIRAEMTPALLAEDRVRRVVVMTDVGTGPHLASRLLATGPGASESASAALEAWADALAGLHSRAPLLHNRFRDELARRSAVAAVEPRNASTVRDAVRHLEDGLAAIGVEVGPEARRELLALGDGFETDLEVLTPTDACPDNNVTAADGSMTLLDFEGAELRHAALDAAYLLVPWPTCWCAWTLDEQAAARALSAYRRRLGSTEPAVLGAAFERDLERATTYWRWLTMGWFIGGAIEETSTDALSDRPAPTRRQRVRTSARKLAAQSGDGTPPALAALAERVAEATRERWGRLDLGLAPAFLTPASPRARAPRGA